MDGLEKALKKALTKLFIQEGIIDNLKKDTIRVCNSSLNRKYKGTKLDIKGLKYEFSNAYCSFHDDFGGNWGDVDLPKIDVTISFVLHDLNKAEKNRTDKIAKDWYSNWDCFTYSRPTYSDGIRDFFILFGYSVPLKDIKNILDGQDHLDFTSEYEHEY